jgi:transposase
VPFNFVACDRDQELLLPPSMREWLAEDHLAWFVLDAVDAIDLGAFYAEYRDDGWGRAAFDPKMMVALLLYAYAVGERSSRQIERRCREDVAFRVICANRIPDHATIARFRVRHEQALAATFTQVLVLSARAGLVSVGVVALDGSPISGNASPGATRTYATIREEVDAILEQAAETDAAEDEQFRGARGDELPAPLADRRSRLERLRRCREELEREEAEAQAEYAAKLAWRADWEAEHGRKLTGRKPTPPDPEGLVKRKANTTDPDTRMITRTGRRTVQGFNVQVVANTNQIVVAAEVTQSINDGDQLEPMVDCALSELRLGRSRRQRRLGSPRQRRGGQRRSDSGRVGLGCTVRRAGRSHQCSAEILPPWVCSASGLLRSSRRSARAGARLAAQTITLELKAIQKKIAITTPKPP